MSAATARRTAEPDAPLELARMLYALRGARRAFIPPEILGEPAWDILLDLYISEAEGRSLSVTALGIGSRSPSATGLRYVASLETHGLVVRERDIHDGRRSFVRLSAAGRQAMDALLTEFLPAA